MWYLVPRLRRLIYRERVTSGLLMVIRCIIVDDEPPARDELAYLLSGHGDVTIVDQAGSASSAVAAIRKHSPDLVFLDIEMPGGSGFDVAASVSDMERPPMFIFATAYDRYAVQAFEESAADYILKPFSEERISKSLEKIRATLAARIPKDLRGELASLFEQVAATKAPAKVSVEHKGRILLLSPSEIVFCVYADKRVMVHTKPKAYPLHGIPTMDKLAKHLASAHFFRCHRNYLINLDHIKAFAPWFNGKYNLTMADDPSSEIAVSRSRVKAFKDRLGI